MKTRHRDSAIPNPRWETNEVISLLQASDLPFLTDYARQMDAAIASLEVADREPFLEWLCDRNLAELNSMLK